MKKIITLFYLFLFFISSAQELPKKNTLLSYKDCKTKACKIKTAFLTAERFLEEDNIVSSQEWLDYTKNLQSSKIRDTTTVFIHSLQSELFYYNGLFQFGLNEAEKAITNSIYLKDSLLISNGYFFKGINLYELSKLKEAEKMLWKARDFQPETVSKKYLRSAILKEHIYNNLAQIKQRINQSDSAIWYNTKAYSYAKISNSKRAIPNIEQTFAVFYIDNNKIEDAIYYLKKSIVSAQKSNYHDIVLSNYGFLLHCYTNNPKKIDQWFNEGLELLKQKKINISYKAYFFKTSIEALKKNNRLEKMVFAQENLIKINEEIALNNNNYIQNITKQYVRNENELLKQELNLTKSKKEQQIFYILVATMAIILIGLWYFFKQRQKFKNQEIETLKQNQEIAKLEALIDGEETERRRIAQDLHDGINGDLSAIKYRISSLDDFDFGSEEKAEFQKIIEMIDDSCSQVRSISHNLMPASILNFGLVETVKQYCSKISSSHKLEIDFQYFGTNTNLPKKSETIIFRIIQELINNIVKHSQATSAMVQFNFHENELSITVEDNGKGFDIKTVQNGLGLINISSRIHFLKAQLDVNSSNSGTSFHITMDLNTL